MTQVTCERGLGALIAACPSFKHHEAYAAFTAGDSLPYLDAAAFALHLVDKLEQAETSEFPAVFSVVEALLVVDEPGVGEVVTAGLIEDLQNAAASRGHGLSGRFRPWLSPGPPGPGRGASVLGNLG